MRLQRDRRGWRKDTETTLDDMRKGILAQEDREFRGTWARRGYASKVEILQLKFDERKAEFSARLTYLKTLSLT